MNTLTRCVSASRPARVGAALVVLAAASMATAPATVRAGTTTYSTTTGATNDSGEPLDAQVVFTTRTGEIDITLSNLLENPRDDAQLISALTFTVSGVTGTVSLASSSGNTSSIDTSNGTYTAGAATSPLPSWAATNSGTSLQLNALTGSKPSDLIIGPDDKGFLDPTKGGLYSNANSSISQHNPVVLGSAYFVIDDAGVSSDSAVTSVTFQFGTTPGSNLSVGVAHLPEPSSMTMGLSALAVVASVLFRRHQRRRRRRRI